MQEIDWANIIVGLVITLLMIILPILYYFIHGSLKWLKKEAERLKIPPGDTVTYERYYDGKLWEGRTLKKWLKHH